MKTCADGMKKVTLELGGKSPNIVFADADLDAALRGATTGIFYGKGEVCAAGSRLLVEASIHDEFVAKLAERARSCSPAIRWIPRRGSARSSRRSRSGGEKYVEDRQEGRRAARAGGERADNGTGKGYFYSPTIFTGVTNAMGTARGAGGRRCSAAGSA